MSNRSEALYLGIVRQTRPTHATVEPLVESTTDGAAWAAPITNGRTRFATRGFVHWHEPPPEARTGSVWQFELEEHPFAEQKRRPEHLQISSYSAPVEVLDLRAWPGLADLQSLITSDGISFSPSPLARRLLLWIDAERCVGPVLLRRTDDAQRWMLERPEAHQDAGRMPVWRVPSGVVSRVLIEGERWFLSPRQSLGQSAGVQNWASDVAVARGILGRIRKMDAGLAKALSVTEAVFRSYLDRIEAGQLANVDPTIERARADRLRGIGRVLHENATVLREATTALLQTDEIQSELQKQIAVERDRLLDQRRAEIDASLSSLQGRVNELDAQLTKKRAEISRVTDELTAKRRDLEDKTASFEAELTTRLQEIQQHPERLFADVSILRIALALSAKTARVQSPLPSSRAERAVEITAAGPHKLLDARDGLRTALVSMAALAKLSPYAMMALHSSFVVGSVPIVFGLRAYDLVRTYATVVAGARLYWVPVGSSILEPRDLLGRVDPSAARITPEAYGILEAAQDANHSGRLHVVLLDGFNRAPCEAYLLPILQCAEAARRGDDSRLLPLANESLVAKDDAFADVARLRWPPSLLIACIPTAGATTLPVANPLWRYVSVIDADDRERGLPENEGRPVGAQAAMEIIPEQWLKAVEEARTLVESPTKTLDVVAAKLAVAPPDIEAARSMRGVLVKNAVPASDADALAIASILVGRSDVTAKMAEEALQSSAVRVPGWKDIQTEARNLRA